jgi:hypothetical protein
MPAAAATTPNLGNAARLFGALRNRLTVRRSGRSAQSSNQARTSRYDYCDNQMTHIEFLLVLRQIGCRSSGALSFSPNAQRESTGEGERRLPLSQKVAGTKNNPTRC